jgi:hypothetical protein
MKILLAAALIIAPLASAAPAVAVAPTPVTVARYTFDTSLADSSGRGGTLTLRTVSGGAVRYVAAGTGRYAAFPAACARGAAVCARALLEAPNDADLNPGTRTFSWGASIAVTKAQVVGSSNVVQKGVATTDSQWKMQIGATAGRAQCVVVGKGSTKAYVVRSSVSVTDGKWHKILCGRSGGALTVSVDGMNRGSLAIPAALSITNTLPLRIGGPNFTTTSDMFHGAIDDVYAVLV